MDAAAERAAILAAESAWAEAIARHDADAVLAFFAPDGASLPPDGPTIVGAEPRRAYLAALFAEPAFASDWETTAVEIAASGDLAWSMGTTTHAGTTPDGAAVHEEGKYVTVWRKVDGAWKVVADIWNTTSAETSAAPAPSSVE